ncbi:hypothetical protein T01_14724 [Trichinella spiralis]|uniref:Uncharacterized protein n=1 Tax=Trichinella spiralis TaxID=6334 RepID=A0A0V1AQZ3_TRISP|nr:hypothetical protein T01_14724 [Trichinella spiralis]
MHMLFDKRWRCVTKVQVQDATFSLKMLNYAWHRAQLVCSIIVYFSLALCSNSYKSSISNLRKPAFSATCAVSVFYANWAI